MCGFFWLIPCLAQGRPCSYRYILVAIGYTLSIHLVAWLLKSTQTLILLLGIDPRQTIYEIPLGSSLYRDTLSLVRRGVVSRAVSPPTRCSRCKHRIALRGRLPPTGRIIVHQEDAACSAEHEPSSATRSPNWANGGRWPRPPTEDLDVLTR